jgi:DNA-binding response OmpR family regulator
MADPNFKILIVEDDKFLRGLIAQKLDKEGYQVVEALDGEDGVKKAGAERPNLILLDLIMPGVDGFQVLSRIKSDQDLKDTPVIILSNLGQEEDIKKGMALGAADFLIKAHNTLEEIIGKIETILKTSKP